MRHHHEGEVTDTSPIEVEERNFAQYMLKIIDAIV